MTEDYDHLFRYIIVGDISVGKSCLMMQFTKSTFKTQYYATLGVEFGGKTIDVKGKRVKIQIWDTAGQETFQSITRSYYKGAIGAFLVYDITRPETFEHCTRWLNDVRQYGPKEIKIILIGNKIDMEEERKVTKQEGQEFAEKNGLLFIETSAKTAENVHEAFLMSAQNIMEGIEMTGIDPSKQTGIKINEEDDDEKDDDNGDPNNKQKKKNKFNCCLGKKEESLTSKVNKAEAIN